MITRIVKLTIQPERVEEFIQNFKANKKKIRASAGCKGVELLRDSNEPSIFFTYSKWESAGHLEMYRKSDLFKGIWSVTKPMFVLAAEAWSTKEFDRA
jgi:quinol monooxygenase YgiN